jgi:hypothetical protein
VIKRSRGIWQGQGHKAGAGEISKCIHRSAKTKKVLLILEKLDRIEKKKL